MSLLHEPPAGDIPHARQKGINPVSFTICCSTFSAKPGKSANSTHSAVIENGLAGKPSEHLVLVGFDELHVRAARAVEHRHKIGLEASVVGREFPWLGIALFSLGFAGISIDAAELVRGTGVKSMFSLAALVSPKP